MKTLRGSWAAEPRARPVVLQFAFFNLQIEACDDGTWVPSLSAEAESRFFLAGSPRYRHVFHAAAAGARGSEEQKSSGPVCLQSHIYRQSHIFRGYPYSKKLGFSGKLRDSVTHDRHPADRFQCLVDYSTLNCKSV